MEWGRGRLFDQDAAQLFQVLVKEARSMRCTGVTTKEERRQRPHGKIAVLSCRLKLSDGIFHLLWLRPGCPVGWTASIRCLPGVWTLSTFTALRSLDGIGAQA